MNHDTYPNSYLADILATAKNGVTIAPPVSTGPTKLLPCSGLHSLPADPLLA